MRKIGLLVVLITMVMFSCVDNKESAAVEQIRTAKTAWLQAQADMMKAQGEAQKILAETEKLKAENDAKNEAARIEIERLLAEAQAAKDEGEAAVLKAKAEKIKAEMEMANERFEDEMRQAQLAYELAVLKNDVEKIKLQKKLAELQADLDLNPALRKLYKEYATAIDELAGLNGKVLELNEKIWNKENEVNEKVYDKFIADIDELEKKIAKSKEELKEAEAIGGLSYEAASAKIKELKDKLPELISTIDAENAKMIENYDKYVELKNNLAEVKKPLRKANKELKDAKAALDEATNANSDDAIKALKAKGYSAVPQSYLAVEKDIEKHAAEIENKLEALNEATKALEDSTKIIASVEEAKFKTLEKYTPLNNELEKNNKTIQENTIKLDKAQGLIDGTNNNGLQSIFDKAEAEQTEADNLLKKLQDELKGLTSGTPAYANKELEIEVQKGLCTTKAEATKTAKEKLDAQKSIVKAMNEANKKLNDRNTAIDKELIGLNITLNGDGAKVEGLVNRLDRLTNGIVEGMGQYWIAQYDAKVAHERAIEQYNDLNELYTEATTDHEALVAAAQKEVDAKIAAVEEAKEPVIAAREAIAECNYTIAKTAKEEAESKHEEITKKIQMYEFGVNGELEELNTEIKNLKEAIADDEASLKEANEKLAAFNELTPEEQEIELNIYYLEIIEEIKKEIANLKIAIEGKQAEIEQIQKLIEAQQATE
ncbi:MULTISPECIES: hypothetical protein [Butyricimonas]|uniref:hypothetical protein n=1 Tax=Butyricimonas TaxID=574697 RepID=UPI0007FB5508|nr:MULTISPECIES: hypothetical protein [Butyricimonas]